MRAVGAILVAALFIASGALGIGGTRSAPAWGPNSVPIDHIVIIMMENRAFDNYFGTYCPTAGPYCMAAVNGEPAGLCVPNAPQGGEPGLTTAVVDEAISEEDEVVASHEANSTEQINETFTGSTIGEVNLSTTTPTLTIGMLLSNATDRVTAKLHIDALPIGSMLVHSVVVSWNGTLVTYAEDDKSGTLSPRFDYTFKTPGTYAINATVYATDAGVKYNASTVTMSITVGSNECSKPFELGVTEMHSGDLPHNYPNTVGAIDGGYMDGFYQYEGNKNQTFGYYNASTIPLYWDLAEEYSLGDYFFSSAESYSLPNHWFLVAGSAPPNSFNGASRTRSFDHEYLNQSNATETVEDLLNNSPNVSWKYYDWALPTYHVAISGGWTSALPSAYNLWNPLAAKAESYTQWYVNHFVSRDQIFFDAAAGALPDISYVIPYPAFSDHALSSNISTGEAFVSQVVDAIEESPDWNSTAIFLSWDDYGGWYDGVPPPLPVGSPGGPITPTNVSADLSIRVPLIVISPYTPRGQVVNSLGYFESLLHFVEWRYDLGCINFRDCDAPLPFGYFNFNQTARPPIIFPTNYTNATYPMEIQHGSEIPCPNNCSIDPKVWNTDSLEDTANYTEDDDD